MIEHLAEQLRELQYQGVQATLLIHVCAIVLHMGHDREQKSVYSWNNETAETKGMSVKTITMS